MPGKVASFDQFLEIVRHANYVVLDLLFVLRVHVADIVGEQLNPAWVAVPVNEVLLM